MSGAKTRLVLYAPRGVQPAWDWIGKPRAFTAEDLIHFLLERPPCPVPLVIVLDNASLHRSHAVQDALPPVVDREGAPVQAQEPSGGQQITPDEVDDTPASPEEIDAQLRAHAVKLREELERDHPQVWEAYVQWYAGQRKFPPLDQLSGPALKGAVTKLERDLDAAKNPQAQGS